jgi:hypothetical protein
LPAACSTADQAHSSKSLIWLTCSRRLRSQLPLAGTQVPRPRPDRIRALGLMAMQARREPGLHQRTEGTRHNIAGVPGGSCLAIVRSE